MLDTRLQNQTQSFLDEFGAALETGDINAVVEMFQDECYWRDLVSIHMEYQNNGRARSSQHNARKAISTHQALELADCRT